MQVFGYELFFMSDRAFEYLERSDGWEIGVGPSIVVVSSGMGKSLTSTTMRADVYAFIFNQQGLMAGLSIQGVKDHQDQVMLVVNAQTTPESEQTERPVVRCRLKHTSPVSQCFA